MRIIKRLIMFLLLMMPLYMIAQNTIDSIKYAKERLRSIDVHKIGFGLEYGFGHDYSISPKVYYEYGSNYGLLNYSTGIKLTLINPLFHVNHDRLSAITLPIFVAVDVNVIRWKYNSVYIGAEFDYNLSLSSNYYSATSKSINTDGNVAQNFSTIYGNIGVKLSHWNVSCRYGYDLKPRFNQKYIFESADYDYEAVKSTLFQRKYFILSLAYYFSL